MAQGMAGKLLPSMGWQQKDVGISATCQPPS